jgi:hypothetical protein
MEQKSAQVFLTWEIHFVNGQTTIRDKKYNNSIRFLNKKTPQILIYQHLGCFFVFILFY